jgi:hypothetical protein
MQIIKTPCLCSGAASRSFWLHHGVLPADCNCRFERLQNEQDRQHSERT